MDLMQISSDYTAAINTVFLNHVNINNTDPTFAAICGFNAVNKFVFTVFYEFNKRNPGSEVFKNHAKFIKYQFEFLEHAKNEIGKWSMQQFAGYMYRENERIAKEMDGKQ